MLEDKPEDTVFVVWSYGPRACPGKKFSQVEFVATIAFLLKRFCVEPAVRGSEKEREANERLKGVVEDSYFFMAPKMARPKDAGVVLVER
jgi:cytochrome P450